MNTISRNFEGFDEVHLEELLKSNFKEIGFGVLHEIDFQETLQNKIGKDIGLYKQLQICNPHLAYEAIQLDPRIGIQLPCNVVIRKEENGLAVDIQSPLDSIPDNSPKDLRDMAEELTQKIEKLLEEIDN